MLTEGCEPTVVRFVTEAGVAAARHAARRQTDQIRGAQLQSVQKLEARTSRKRAEMA